MNLTKATQERLDAQEALRDFDERVARDRAIIVSRLTEAKRVEAMAQGGLDVERIARAERVLSISGRIGGESCSAIEAARLDVLAGGGALKWQFRGTKSYDRWEGQRCDCEYGYGPRHGNIVFRIGLAERGRDLGEQEIEDALYLLAHVDEYLSARKVQA